ncbi:MAG: glycosyltransferase [Candidatus Woesebacteria bacterium]|jgi:glycosyltransferase involved in cell wall biosynthesis
MKVNKRKSHLTKKTTLKLGRMELDNLKIAIVHDVLYEYGGAQRVLEELLALFPKADFYTLYLNKKDKNIVKSFQKRTPKTSVLQRIPGLEKLGRFFSITKLYSCWYFYCLDLSNYDLIITSTHSFNAKLLRKPPEAVHLSYLHTTPKYLYQEFNELAFIRKFPFNFLLFPVMAMLRLFDQKGAQNPDIMIASSENVRQRIKRYYHRDAVVIYPPVLSLKKFTKPKEKKYFLACSRLVKQKGMELIVKTCSLYKLPLLVAGDGYLLADLKKIAGPTVEFVGKYRPEKDLPQLYKNAKALLYAAIDEDFGIVPVEAMAFGVPVVAFKGGGVKETVIDGKTGVFFKTYTVKALYQAIKRLEKSKVSAKACYQQSRKFTKQVFRKEIFKVLDNLVEHNGLKTHPLSPECSSALQKLWLT